jgi:hypothetical protein
MQQFPYFTICCDSQLAIERIQYIATELHRAAEIAQTNNLDIKSYLIKCNFPRKFEYLENSQIKNSGDVQFGQVNKFPIRCGTCHVLFADQYIKLQEIAKTIYPNNFKLPK